MNAVVKFFGIGLLAVLGLILMVCESDEMTMFILTKVLGAGIFALAVKLYKQLEDEHKNK
jgi:hypothetical protein